MKSIEVARTDEPHVKLIDRAGRTLDAYGRSGNIIDRRTSTYVKPFALDRISRLADHPTVVAAAMAAAVCTVVHAYYESVLRSPRKRPDPRN